VVEIVQQAVTRHIARHGGTARGRRRSG
jgi:hypothetical protein